MFSMGFKSGEFGGQIISDSFTNPRDFKTAVVAFAACDGALSCIKTTLFSRDKGKSSNHGSSAVFKNWQYVAAVNFNPSGTRNGPTSSSPMMPAQIITPPPTSLLTPHSRVTCLTIVYPTFSPTIKTIQRRS